MKIRPILSLIVLVAVLFGSTGAVQSAPLDWQPVAPGIEYRKYIISGPNEIFVSRMDRANPNVTIESSIAMGKLASGRETVRNMASRYDQAINYWGGTWGNRNRVAVAINGYYFDPTTGTPWRGQFHSSWYSLRHQDNQNGSGFAWKLDGSAFIGNCVYHKRSSQYIRRSSDGWNRAFDGINISRDTDHPFIVYTPQYDNNTHTESISGSVEILVEMYTPAYVVAPENMPTGIVREIRQNQGSTHIPFDHVVLSAQDFPAEKLAALQVGDEIGINQVIQNCDFLATQDRRDWTNIYSGIGGDYYFLKNGIVQTSFSNQDAYVANSRTAIAFNDQYIFFIVVDGFNKGVSVGMKITDLGAFARDQLGATEAISQDSGGSSTMVVNGEVVNNTYCNFTRKCGISAPENASPGLGLEEAAPSEYGDPSLPGWGAAPELTEALVGNGMLMVAVEPKSQYSFHIEGENLLMAQERNIRLGPGTNYDAIGSAPVDGNVAILPHALNGVLSKNLAWWKVQYGDMTGWMGFPLQLSFSQSLPFVQSRIPVQQNAPAGPANPFIAPNGLWGGRR